MARQLARGLLALGILASGADAVAFSARGAARSSKSFGARVRYAALEEGRWVRGRAFPLVVTPADASAMDPVPLVRDCRHDIDRLLSKHGAVLFRRFRVEDAERFSAFVKALDYEPFPYVGGAAVRTVVADRVFTSNESPPSEPIPFHCEMAQVPRNPGKIFFYCEVPAAVGGQTPILHCGELLESLRGSHPAFVEKLQRHGVRYVRVMPEEDDPASALGRSWRSAFQAPGEASREDARRVAEAVMRAEGFDWEWLPDGSCRTITKPLPAVWAQERGGAAHGAARTAYPDALFNQIVAAYTGWTDSRNVPEEAVLLADGGGADGNGSLLPEALMRTYVRTHFEHEVAFMWEKGDVLLLDNRQVMHARRTFERPRRTLASLAADHLA